MNWLSMKDDGSKLMLVGILAILLIACVAVVSENLRQTSTEATAMKEGYSKQTLPGVIGTHWVKDGVKRPQ